METEGVQNVQIGQYQEFNFNLLDSVTFRFLGQNVYLQDTSGNDALRFQLDGGLLKYSIYDPGSEDWLPNQTMTTPTVSSEDSTQLPHTPSNNKIMIESGGFSVFLSSVQKLLLLNSDLQMQIQNMKINNQLVDFAMLFKTNVGQQFVLKDYDTNAKIISIGVQGIDMNNKKIMNLTYGTNVNDAVTYGQLTSFYPSTMQMGPSDSQLTFKTFNDTTLMTIDSTCVKPAQVIQYTSQPTITNPLQVANWGLVTSELASYQPLNEKGNPSGYAGLDGFSKIDNSNMPTQSLKLDGNVKTYNNVAVLSDQLDEGIINLYYTTDRVLNDLDGQKGQINGIASLDENGKVPTSQIASIPMGQTYSGPDASKTLPIQYPLATPVIGDRYIATDTSSIYILTETPYTTASNWLLLSTGGVDSVNGQNGVVSLVTTNIPEGTNKYFATGISDYKASVASTPNELAKLDTNAFIQETNLNPSFSVSGGSILLVDNQSNQMQIQNKGNNDPLLTVSTTQIQTNKPLVNDGNLIVNSNQYTDKAYVDGQISSYQPLTVGDSNSNINVSAGVIQTNVDNVLVKTDVSNQSTSYVPIVYDSSVPVNNQQQLTTKQYVDTLLNDFVQNTGVIKEYLEIVSNTPLTTDGRITGWNSVVVSSTSERIVHNIDDTFSLDAGVYKFFLCIKIKEFMATGIYNVSVVIRDSDDQTNYVTFDFSVQGNADGGNQELTVAYPYMWKFLTAKNIEVYAQIGDVSYQIYESYLLIDEVEPYGLSIGKDRITDVSLNSKLQINANSLDFAINTVDVAQMGVNSLDMQLDKTVTYNPGTSITDNTQLTTKEYVDLAVENSRISITDLGQVLGVDLTSDQTSSLNAGGVILFNNPLVNSALTISVDNLGVFTFEQGFIYKISFRVGLQFGAQTGFVTLGFKNVLDLSVVDGSRCFLVTQPSSNTQVAVCDFYLDMRNALASQSYAVSIISALNVNVIYKAYSSLTVEQVQLISTQQWDRIQLLDTSTRILLFDQGIEHTIDNQLVENVLNTGSSVEQRLMISDKSHILTSTTDSQVTSTDTLLRNPDNTNMRQSTLTADVNGEVQALMQAQVSAGGTQSIVNLGGVNADTVQLCVQDPNTPIVELSSTNANVNVPLSLENNQITNLAYPTLPTDATSKAYVDNMSPIGSVIMWPAVSPPSNYLVCDGQVFDELVYTQLFAILGVNNVPDLRGAFIRGYDPTATRDPDGLTRNILSTQTSNLTSHTHTIPEQLGVSGTVSGTTSTVNLDHDHDMHNSSSNMAPLLVTTSGSGSNIDIGGGDDGTNRYDVKYSSFSSSTSGSRQNTQGMDSNVTHSHTISGTFTTDIPSSISDTTGITETRPFNIMLQYIIKIA